MTPEDADYWAIIFLASLAIAGLLIAVDPLGIVRAYP